MREIIRSLKETTVILFKMSVYIAIKSSVDAFRYGIDVPPEWFITMDGVYHTDAMVDGNKVIYCDIDVKIGKIRAFYGDYIGRFPDGSVQVFKKDEFHSLYTLKI